VGINMDWDEYFFDIIKPISKKSKDRTKVGCIIVSPYNEIVSTGFNGFPRVVEDRPDIAPERYQREIKLMYIEHSERNSIYAAARRGIPLEGCKIYVEWNPCADCMRAIIQSGIKEVVLNGRSEAFNNKELRERWEQQIQCAQIMAGEAGVKIRIWH
jgi:dCMP deaminase